MEISVNKDFSNYPGGRKRKYSECSGEEFRDDFLVPKYREAIKKKEKLTIDLDGTSGMCASFLDEVFSGLLINYDFKLEDILSTIIFKTTENERYVEEIMEDLEYTNKDIKEYGRGKKIKN